MWASALERAGVQVVYGFIEWKTHAKMSMVVRREEGGATAPIATSAPAIITRSPRASTPISASSPPIRGQPRRRRHLQLHHRLYRAARARADRDVAAAPARRSSRRLIDREIANARAGRHGAIWAKMNSLVDPAIIDKLYEASAGRGRRRPHHPRHLLPQARRAGPVARISASSRSSAASSSTAGSGASAMATRCPTATPRSTSRSADWMPRNFDRRVEYALPIENDTVHAQILDQVMVANIIDNEQSWQLNADGSYTRLAPGPDEKPFNLHHYFMTNPSLSGPRRGAPHRAARPPTQAHPSPAETGLTLEAPDVRGAAGRDHRHRVQFGPPRRLFRGQAHPLGHLQREGACRARPRRRRDRARRRRRGRSPRSTASACWSGR